MPAVMGCPWVNNVTLTRFWIANSSMIASDSPKTKAKNDRLYYQLSQNQLFRYVDLGEITYLLEQCSEQQVSTDTVVLCPEQ